MDIFYWSNFKKQFEKFAYITVYCGYFFHLINFFGNREGLIYILIGYLLIILIGFQATFNPVIVLGHSLLFLYNLEFFYPKIEGKLFSIAFFIPFYTMILYFFLSIFGIDEKIELIIKNQRLKKIELEKKRKQKEWEILPDEEKNKILEEKKRIEHERLNKINVEKKRIEKEREERKLKIALEKTKQIELENIKLEEEKQKQINLEIEAEKLKIEKIEEQKRNQELKEKREREFKEKKEREHKEFIKRKILEAERRKELESEAIQELIDEGLIDNNSYSGKNVRESIPTEVKVAVWNRDKQRCVTCNSVSKGHINFLGIRQKVSPF